LMYWFENYHLLEGNNQKSAQRRGETIQKMTMLDRPPIAVVGGGALVMTLKRQQLEGYVPPEVKGLGLSAKEAN